PALGRPPAADRRGTRGDREPEGDPGRRADRQPALRPGARNHGAVHETQPAGHDHHSGDALRDERRLQPPDHPAGRRPGRQRNRRVTSMGLPDIYQGRQTWADYLSQQSPFTSLVKAPPAGLQPEVERLAGGIARLNSDFNLLLGDVIWKCEMQQEALGNILHEIRLAEFEREANAYRSRAERSYLNGWHAEALNDFLEAEKRNYPDFTVHRSIAHIYLYHVVNLPEALKYFLKAAKYARPTDPAQAAEAHFFAAMVCMLERQTEEAFAQLQEAILLNPDLCEAHYQWA